MNTAASPAEAALKIAGVDFVQAIADEEKAARGVADCQVEEAKLVENARPDHPDTLRAISEVRTKRELFQRDRDAATRKADERRKELYRAIRAFLPVADRHGRAEQQTLDAEIREAVARARAPFIAAEKRLSAFDFSLRDNSGTNQNSRPELLRDSERLLTAWQEFSALPAAERRHQYQPHENVRNRWPNERVILEG